MNGIISRFNTDKGYGFISADEGRIFFHISDIKSKQILPEEGQSVEFEITVTEKGSRAINIRIRHSAVPLFIALGNTRIKTSSIKNYGIENESQDYQVNILCLDKNTQYETERLNMERASTSAIWWTRHIEDTIKSNKAEKEAALKSPKYQLSKENRLWVLYVNTYHGEEYRFYEYDCGFDIHEKQRELDKLLLGKE